MGEIAPDQVDPEVLSLTSEGRLAQAAESLGRGAALVHSDPALAEARVRLWALQDATGRR